MKQHTLSQDISASDEIRITIRKASKIAKNALHIYEQTLVLFRYVRVQCKLIRTSPMQINSDDCKKHKLYLQVETDAICVRGVRNINFRSTEEKKSEII